MLRRHSSRRQPLAPGFLNARLTSFLGSANESRAAFELNYELIWEHDGPETVAWVREEFDALWNSPFAVALADLSRPGRGAPPRRVERGRDHLATLPA